jgi:hypothetical protein
MRSIPALALLLAVPTFAGAAVQSAPQPATVRAPATAADTLPLFAGSDSARMAHPPRRAVEFRPPADHPVLRSRRVTTDAELEAALGDLRAGDEIRLVPGRTYSQGWWSVRKLGAGYATVRTDTVLPNRAVDTTDLRWMAKIATRGQNEPAMRIDEGIRGVRFRGVGFVALPNVTNLNTLVFVGKKDGMDTRTTVPPSDVVFDRVVMYAHDSLDLTRCTLLNARRVALVRSTLWCHGGSSDAMALGGWTGSQQLLIEENRITANGHGVLFGGNDAPDSTFMPRDLVIRGNRIYKPLSWRGRPGKTLLELKMADGVEIAGNVFEGHWVTEQAAGFALLLKSTNQSGGNPWAQTTNVHVHHNIIRNVAGVFNVAASPEKPAKFASRFLIEQNLIYDVGPMFERWSGYLLQLTGPVDDVAFRHNTFVHSGPAAGLAAVDADEGRRTAQRFNWTDNVMTRGQYGFKSSVGDGIRALRALAGDSWLWTGNVLAGEGPTGVYPAATTFVPNARWLGFADARSGDPGGFVLPAASRYAKAGADIPAVMAATAAARALH